MILAEVPALPLHTAGKYVAGAYIVLFALVLVYVSIMAIRLSRIESELGELLSVAEQRAEDPTQEFGDGAPSAAGAAGERPPGTREPQRESAPAYPVKGHT